MKFLPGMENLHIISPSILHSITKANIQMTGFLTKALHIKKDKIYYLPSNLVTNGKKFQPVEDDGLHERHYLLIVVEKWTIL